MARGNENGNSAEERAFLRALQEKYGLADGGDGKDLKNRQGFGDAGVGNWTFANQVVGSAQQIDQGNYKEGIGNLVGSVLDPVNMFGQGVQNSFSVDSPILNGVKTNEFNGTQFTGASDQANDRLGQSYDQSNAARAQQASYINALQDQAAGRGGPSVAQQQLRSGLEQSQAAVASQVASQRGGNSAMARRNAVNAQANQGANVAGQSAMLRAQEMNQAQQQLGSALSGMRGQDLSQMQAQSSLYGTTAGLQAGQEQFGSKNELAYAQLRNEREMANAANYMKAQDINAQIAQKNTESEAKNRTGQIGSVMSFFGGMGGGMAGGGEADLDKYTDYKVNGGILESPPTPPEPEKKKSGIMGMLGGMMGGGGGGSSGSTSSFGGGAGMASGGSAEEPMSVSKIAQYFERGGKVPGEPKHDGDDTRNDVVPALLSKGEVVLPNSITQHPAGPERAAGFVQALQLRHKQDEEKAQREHVDHVVRAIRRAEGGEVSPAEEPQSREFSLGRRRELIEQLGRMSGKKTAPAEEPIKAADGVDTGAFDPSVDPNAEQSIPTVPISSDTQTIMDPANMMDAGRKERELGLMDYLAPGGKDAAPSGPLMPKISSALESVGNVLAPKATVPLDSPLPENAKDESKDEEGLTKNQKGELEDARALWTEQHPGEAAPWAAKTPIEQVHAQAGEEAAAQHDESKAIAQSAAQKNALAQRQASNAALMAAPQQAAPKQPAQDSSLVSALKEQNRVAENESKVRAEEMDAQAKQKIISMAQYQSLVKNNSARSDEMVKSILDHKIDPARYWNSRSHWQKAASVVSMMMGGYLQGSGVTKENPAYEMIRSRIKDDIDSQKDDLTNKKTALNYYMQQGHDMEAAERLAMADGMDVMAANMQSKLAAIGPEKAAATGAMGVAIQMKQEAEEARARQAAIDHAKMERADKAATAAREQQKIELEKAKFMLDSRRVDISEKKLGKKAEGDDAARNEAVLRLNRLYEHSKKMSLLEKGAVRATGGAIDDADGEALRYQAAEAVARARGMSPTPKVIKMLLEYEIPEATKFSGTVKSVNSKIMSALEGGSRMQRHGYQAGASGNDAIEEGDK